MLTLDEIRGRMQPYTNASISRLSGVHVVTLSRIRHGKQTPSLEVANAIVAAIGGLSCEAKTEGKK